METLRLKMNRPIVEKLRARNPFRYVISNIPAAYSRLCLLFFQSYRRLAVHRACKLVQHDALQGHQAPDRPLPRRFRLPRHGLRAGQHSARLRHLQVRGLNAAMCLLTQHIPTRSPRSL